MLKPWGRIIVAITLLTLICGCEAFNSGFWEGRQNRAKLKNLRVGMTKSEVIKIMGDPLDDQVYVSPNVWYYYTHIKWCDGNATSDECTPLVFRSGLLVGWGHDYYKRNIAYIAYAERIEKEKAETSELGELVKSLDTKTERKRLEKALKKEELKVTEKPKPVEKKAPTKPEPVKPAPKPEKKPKPVKPVPKPVKPAPKPVKPAPKPEKKPEPAKPVKPEPKPEKKPESAKPEPEKKSDPNKTIDIKLKNKSVIDILKESE